MSLVVLETFGPPNNLTSPYHLELIRALPSGIQLRYFSWREALTGRFDVFHLHWPEALMRGPTRMRNLIRSLLFLVVLVRLRAQRKAIVRTLHNVTPHEPPSALEAAVVRLADRWTTLWITLSDRVSPPDGAPCVVAPHGDFRDRFAHLQTVSPIRGRLVNVGRLRPYKGLDALIAAFRAVADDELSLHVVGRADHWSIRELLRDACADDARIRFIEGYVEEDLLAREVQESELVVLPFTEFTNSSSVILALSLDRPVLVPETPVTAELAEEVGEGWVLTFTGRLEPSDLTSALAAARRRRATGRPDLSRREWPAIGEAHAAAFRQAAGRARDRR